MTQLLTVLFTVAGTLWFLVLVIAVPLLILTVTPRKVMRRRRQVARFTRQLDTRRLEESQARRANQPTTLRRP